LREGNAVHAATGKALDIAIAVLRRLQQQASDFVVVARCGLDQAVVRGTVEKESTVFHQGLFKHRKVK
jgi:hypothetical protein